MKKREKPLKVVIDTNVFISGLILKYGLPRKLYHSWRRGNFTLIVSSYQYQEITEVLNRPIFSFKYHLTKTEIANFLSMISSNIITSKSRTRHSISLRDPKDEPILIGALSGQADYLVTGDQDLLILTGKQELGKLKILTVRDFLSLLPSN